MAEKNIAPDSQSWVESLTLEQILFIITVWNQGGRAGFTELMLFASDRYNDEVIAKGQQREVAQRAADRFFTERAYDEYQQYQSRRRYHEEVEKQENQRRLDPNNGQPLIVDPFK